MHFIDLQAQYQVLKQRIDQRVHEVLDHGQYIMGPEVRELESRLSDYVGVKHVITCANGTDALQLALMALGVKNGDAVFCPAFTFFASAEAISSVGATPVFVDVNVHSFNICPVDLEQKIQAVKTNEKLNPKVIMAVDLFGQPADYVALQAIATKHHLKIIEDAAQGFGGTLGGEHACSFGDIATTSFFPAKPLGCYGDGGAVFTRDDRLADLLNSLRVHGQGHDKYNNIRIGMNSRLDTLQAAILLEKLSVFPVEIEQRNVLANYYYEQLKDYVEVPKVNEGYTSSWAQYTVQLDDRKEVMERLQQKRVPTAVYYARAMHQQTAYANLNVYGGLANSENLANRVMSLPMHPYMDKIDREFVVSSLKEVMSSISS
jgi:dTDP-4-amino-4,6-dideoxygalactose transaminase